MGREVQRLVLAVQFLTRLPTPATAEPPPDWLARSAKYFPLVGIGVGAVAAGVLAGARQIWPSGALAPLLALAAAVALTGALHEDGLADVADAAGGRSREDRLRIMKDPRLGSYGAITLGLALAIKAAALAALPTLAGVAGLIAAHAGGRAAAVVTMSRLPYAAEAQAARIAAPARTLRPGELALALVFAAAPLLLLPSYGAAPACTTAAVLASTAAAWRCALRIGGHTGDVLGAVEQVYELVFLLALAAFQGSMVGHP